VNQAWTVLWAQWRTYRNYSPAGRAVIATILMLLWYCAWAGAAIVAGILAAERDTTTFFEILPTALLIMFLYWQVIPLMMAATGAALDLRKLKIYPIPARDLFFIEVLLRATASLEMLIILTGTSVGMLFNPSLRIWAALACVPFAIFNLLLSLGVRDVVVRLLSRRRLREISAIIFVLFAAVPQFLFRGRDHPFMRWYQRFAPALSFPDLPTLSPWTATGNLIRSEGAAFSVVILAAWCLAAGAFAFWQFHRTLAFDAESAAAAGTPGSARTSLLDRIYSLPSTLLRDPLGAMVEKEVRYLARSPRFRMQFLMAGTFGLIIARTLIRSGSGDDLYWGPDYLTGVSVYSLLLLGEVCFWNSFGFDRAAAQIYFLAPVPFTRALIAKNITAAVFLSLEIVLATTVCLVLQIPIGPQSLLEAFSVAGIAGAVLLTVGNFLSVRNARGVNSQASLRTTSSGRTQGLLLLVYPAAFLPAAIAYIARWLTHSNVVFYAVLAVIAAMAGTAYKIGLDSAAGDAEKRREEMIASLSQGQGPVAT